MLERAGTSSLVLLAVAAVMATRAEAAPAAKRALSAQDYFRMAISQVGKKNYAYALRVFEYLTRIEPGKALYWFNLGNVYFHHDRFDAAAASYEKASRLGGPLTAPARLYLAKCHRKTGKLEVAEALLGELELISLPKNIRAEVDKERQTIAENYLNQGLAQYEAGNYEGALAHVRKSLSVQPSSDAEVLLQLARARTGDTEALAKLRGRTDSPDMEQSLILDVSAGYNSNFYALPSAESQGRAVSNLSFFYDRQLWRDKPEIGASVAILNDELIGVPGERLTRGVVQTSGALASGNWVFYAQPDVALEMNARELRSGRLGLGAGLGYRWPRLSAWFTARHSRILYFEEELSYQSGYSQLRRLFLGWGYGAFSFRAGALNLLEESSDLRTSLGVLPLSGQAWGPSLEVSWERGPWRGEGSVVFLSRGFDKRAEPNGELREDRQLSLNFKVQNSLGRIASVGSRLDLYAALALTRNQSTLGPESIDDRNYHQWIGSGGMVWEFQP